MSDWSSPLIIAALVLGLFVYFAPYAIARSRRHRNSDAILMLNLVLGWTILGWVGALIWAATGTTPAPVDDDLGACPHCAEPIKATAKLCRYCKNEIPESILEIRRATRRQ